MKEDRLLEIIGKIKQAKVAVYGDFCLDVYWEMWEEGSEISVETGNQAAAVQQHYYSPGGAGNVCANLAALKPTEVRALGVIGEDIYGDKLLALLNKEGINTSFLVRQEEKFDTYAFVKQYLGNKELSRTDFGTRNIRSTDTDEKILDSIRIALEECDALIFNQQVPNSISNPEFLTKAQELFSSFPDKMVLVDTRHIKSTFKEVFYKSNELELSKLELGEEIKINKRANKLSKETGKTVFITRGAEGIMVVHPNQTSLVSGLDISAPIDPVGAGDSVVSALALCLSVGLAPLEAAYFANLAAAVTIQKLRTTGTASGEEILNIQK